MNLDPRKIARLIVALGALLAGFGLLWPWFVPGGFEANVFRDDAYYQFVVARHLAAGLGFTFDGVHPAAGVQVAWTLVLAPFAFVLGGAALPAVAAVLGTILHVATTLLVGRLASLFVSRGVAVCLAAYYASRPWVLLEVWNGQETALAMFVLLVWLRRAVEIERGSRAKLGGFLVWSLVLPWVRTDLLVFPVAFIAVNLAARLWRGTQRAPGMIEVAGAASLACYVLGQKVLFGSWLPPSGSAIPWLFHDVFAAGHPSFGATLRRYWWYLRPLLLGGPFASYGFAYGVAAAWFVLAPLTSRSRFAPLAGIVIAALLGAHDLGAACAGAALLVASGGAARRLWGETPGRIVAAAWCAFGGLLVLHLVLRWYPRDYYFVPAAAAGSLTIACLAGRWLGELGVVAFVPIAKRQSLLAVLLLLAMPLELAMPQARFPWQAEMTFAARWASELLGPDAGIASFNTGILAWEHDGPVRNLDGVADGASLPALRGRRLVAWLEDEGIGWLLETPRQVADTDPDRIAPHASGRYLGPKGRGELEPRLAFDLPGVAGRHPGTDCQMLFRLPGAEPLDLANEVLGRDGGGVAVMLATHEAGKRLAWVVETGGVEKPWTARGSALGAPFVVTRIDAAHGLIKRAGRVVLEW